MASISPARQAAFDILLILERGKGHSVDLLRARRISALSAADRHLATALVLGSLRWQIALDSKIKPLLARPNARLDAEVLIALRLAALQFCFLDRIPARAAIDESVELARRAGHRFASGMVNAVLRKLASSLPRQTPPGVDANESTADRQPDAALPVGFLPTSAYPAWMIERWTRFFGREQTRAICAHGQTQSTHALRLSNPELDAELAMQGIQLVPGELLTAARRVVSGDVLSTTAFREDRARIQDEGSQLVAEIAGRGNTILDCCAAPGGKTLILAERNPASRIVAYEASSARYEKLRERLSPLGDRVECRNVDATSLSDDAHFDLILADVPCSGTGTLGRNPEIRHRLSPEDLARHAERQRAILSASLRALRPGARLVYSTCSLEPEENEQVVSAVISETPNSRIIPLDQRIGAMRAEGILTGSGVEKLLKSLTLEGFLRLIPGVHGTDGFFVAMIGREA